MKILNLYSGIGGNRKLWGDTHDITAVEIDPEIARVYQDYFPNDTVIIGDAHEYLLKHFREFDFIWSSPPCPTHSKFNHTKSNKGEIKYPDMKLYQEIIFLKKWFTGKWVVENVIPYYEPLMPAKIVGRHLLWCNFRIAISIKGHIDGNPVKYWTVKDYEKEYGYDLSKYNFGSYDRRQKLRNCVHPETGLHILNCAMGTMVKTEQQVLF